MLLIAHLLHILIREMLLMFNNYEEIKKVRFCEQHSAAFPYMFFTNKNNL